MFKLLAEEVLSVLFLLISSILQDDKRKLDDQIAQLKEELEEEHLNSEMSNERFKRAAQQVRTCRPWVTSLMAISPSFRSSFD